MDNSMEEIMAILTAALVVITAFYAWATFKILRANESVVAEMKEQSIAVSRPYVVVAPFIEVDNPIFYLKFSNCGKTAARNLRLTIDKSFNKFGETGRDRDLANLAAFNQPIDSLPPGTEVVFSLAQGFVVFADDAAAKNVPQTFRITATYDFSERTVTEENYVDLRPFRSAEIPHTAQIRKLGEIADALKKLVEHTRKLSA